ncbi:hypothetical protein SCLCIDRAFT_443248 [Scleroderma citrinum Foug A]|uniref:Uncharacterized protein n=1 Tax=Scleroderma citrinum Foug A TaxID=1036808 RepID=A0A0C3AL48_9AGAM|nr:hypothetical protein SCLCIDRAFT_443248 [Scleroderma citrinum Foug A]
MPFVKQMRKRYMVADCNGGRLRAQTIDLPENNARPTFEAAEQTTVTTGVHYDLTMTHASLRQP